MSPEADDEASGVAEGVDPRVFAAFRTWLEALATDPDAVTAAAMTYEALDGAGRDVWLDAVVAEAPSLAAPPIALFGPLLGVEGDAARRGRLLALLNGTSTSQPAAHGLRAWRGAATTGETVAVIVVPLYLEFVELLVCRYRPGFGLTSVRRGPLSKAANARWDDVTPFDLAGATLTPEPLANIVDDLAHALLFDRRAGRPPPEALRPYDYLFTLDQETLSAATMAMVR